MKRRLVHWPIFFSTIVVTALLALGLHFWTGLGYIWAFAIVVVAVLVNGVIIAFEKD